MIAVAASHLSVQPGALDGPMKTARLTLAVIAMVIGAVLLVRGWGGEAPPLASLPRASLKLVNTGTIGKQRVQRWATTEAVNHGEVIVFAAEPDMPQALLDAARPLDAKLAYLRVHDHVALNGRLQGAIADDSAVDVLLHEGRVVAVRTRSGTSLVPYAEYQSAFAHRATQYWMYGLGCVGIALALWLFPFHSKASVSKDNQQETP